MEIYQAFRFDAAHRLTQVPDGHKCANLHGHTFEVVLYVEGPVSENTGWVVDFGDVKRAFAPALDQLDHHYLNEIPGLENPTSENIAKWIWQRLKSELPILTRIRVKESPQSGAIYRGEDD